MKKAMRDKWVKALRSGRYKQSAGSLQDADGYCCLGVLGKSALRMTDDELNGNSFLNEDQEKKCGIDQTIQSRLATMNDNGVPFDMIAGLIATSL